jgi:hypothetical protein
MIITVELLALVYFGGHHIDTLEGKIKFGCEKRCAARRKGDNAIHLYSKSSNQSINEVRTLIISVFIHCKLGPANYSERWNIRNVHFPHEHQRRY